jgi:predicted aconitase
MYLTKKEERMLNGEYGEAVSLAMNILTKVGDIYDAEKMVEINSAHVLGHFGSLHEAGIRVLEKFARLNGKYRVPTTVDPASMDLERWREFKIPEDYAQKQLRLCRAHLEMGVIPTWSCTPYLQGNIPRYGEHISWAESSAVVFANSVIGARTNRETFGLEVAASIAGRTPEFGLHLKENRRGDVLVKVKVQNLRDIDYNTIGYMIGKTFGNKIPVLVGLPQSATLDQLKCMGAAMASSGAIAMYHAIGLTPEANTIYDAFQCDSYSDKIEISRKELKNAEEEISTISCGKIDLIAIGCPHLSFNEVRELAFRLQNKKIHRSVKFWIYTSKQVEALARLTGYADLIESSDAKILTQTCAVVSPINIYGFKTVMTNSAKFANVLPSEHKVDVIYGTIEECIEAAVKGKFGV